MGRQAVPMNLKLINGDKPKRSNEEIERRLEKEKALRIARDRLKPPSWLGKVAKKEFKYIVEQTASVDLLTNLDIHTLAVYCNVYEQYIECNARIIKDGVIVKANKASETVEAAHPLFVKQNQLVSQLRVMQNDLGLSPSARAKLALHTAHISDDNEHDRKFSNV